VKYLIFEIGSHEDEIPKHHLRCPRI